MCGNAKYTVYFSSYFIVLKHQYSDIRHGCGEIVKYLIFKNLILFSWHKYHVSSHPYLTVIRYVGINTGSNQNTSAKKKQTLTHFDVKEPGSECIQLTDSLAQVIQYQI